MDTQEQPDSRSLGFGLFAHLKLGEAREVKAIDLDGPHCKCGHWLDETDVIRRQVKDLPEERFFYCGRCKVFHNPETGRQFQNKW